MSRIDMDEFLNRVITEMIRRRADLYEFTATVSDKHREPQKMEPPDPLALSITASRWTIMEMRLASHDPKYRSAIIVEIQDGRPRMTLFGLPVKARDGLDDFDATILPEIKP